MIISLHKSFQKDIKKCNIKLRKKFIERRNIFELDPFNIVLSNHVLHGDFAGYRSINITGDVRAIYKIDSSKNECIFVRIGTHRQLYK